MSPVTTLGTDTCRCSKDAAAEETARKLLAYCREHDWAGHDPYDALNSETLKDVPFLNSRLPRIALTQLMKRSPVDLRGLARVPRTQNPKALGLFLSALFKLQASGFGSYEESIEYLIERLAALRSSGTSYSCWGYSFPWQGRSILVPAAAPNLVCTVFVADALFDAYEQCGNQQSLEMAVSAAEYIYQELYWKDDERVGFSYPLPSLRGECHNANLLAAALLCRASRYVGAAKAGGLTDAALQVARQSARRQHQDGGWYYAEGRSQHWIDNFHTGYNLVALDSIGRHLRTMEFATSVELGFAFYRSHFFREDAAPKYFHNRTYPIDIHCVAQSIITLVTFAQFDATNIELAQEVLDWAMKHMWDDRGYFYYRVLRLCTIRTSYTRWSQAWMLLALATFLSARHASDDRKANDDLSLVRAL